jgi:hypothetical protein
MQCAILRQPTHTAVHVHTLLKTPQLMTCIAPYLTHRWVPTQPHTTTRSHNQHVITAQVLASVRRLLAIAVRRGHHTIHAGAPAGLAGGHLHTPCRGPPAHPLPGATCTPLDAAALRAFLAQS